MAIYVEIEGNRVIARLDKVRKNLEESLHAGVGEGAKDVSNYIKNRLLAGEMLKDRTGMPRSKTTNSLPAGQLRKDVAVRPSGSGKEFRFTVFVKERSKSVATMLQQGRTGKWYIRPNLKQALHFFLEKGIFAGYPVFSNEVEHPGFKSYPFMKRGLEDRLPYVKTLIKRHLKKGAAIR